MLSFFFISSAEPNPFSPSPEEAGDTERTVSSAPMGNEPPEKILIIVVERVKLTLLITLFAF
jgi:hypothetical protein